MLVSGRLPLIAAASVVVVAVGALLLGGSVLAPPGGGVPPAPPPAVTLDAADRDAVGAEPVQRGADAPAVDPRVTFTDPEAVARAYLAAAHSVSADDEGQTHLRAAPYAVPGTAAATVGVLELDAPPPGATRTATVRDLELLAADRADRRRGYRAAVETRTAAPNESAQTTVLTTHVIVARQPDGRWLVAAETPENPDLAAGED